MKKPRTKEVRYTVNPGMLNPAISLKSLSICISFHLSLGSPQHFYENASYVVDINASYKMPLTYGHSMTVCLKSK